MLCVCCTQFLKSECNPCILSKLSLFRIWLLEMCFDMVAHFSEFDCLWRVLTWWLTFQNLTACDVFWHGGSDLHLLKPTLIFLLPGGHVTLHGLKHNEVLYLVYVNKNVLSVVCSDSWQYIPLNCARAMFLVFTASGQDLWLSVGQCVGAKRVARQAPISGDGFRSPQVELLLGDNSVVQHVDNGIR